MSETLHVRMPSLQKSFWKDNNISYSELRREEVIAADLNTLSHSYFLSTFLNITIYTIFTNKWTYYYFVNGVEGCKNVAE